MMTTPATPAEITHLLKRTSFGITRNRVQELVSIGWEKALESLVDKATSPRVPPTPPFKNIYNINALYEDYFTLIGFEFNRLIGPEIGVGDRMLWFWHGLITSSMSKVFFPPLLWRQHRLMAKHALGNFRQMLIDLTIDPAMLLYLDGSGSSGEAPNENYGRELMELFTMGRGNYTQEDVTAAARALAGWDTEGYPYIEGQAYDPESIHSFFNPEKAYRQPLTFLGKTSYFDVPSVIERILERKACSRFISRKLFEYFIHPAPDSKSIDTLAILFRTSNYEIKPLLSALFRHPEFRTSRGSRARLPIEVLLATAVAFSAPVEAFDWYSYIDATGQYPFEPPNVAGWPLGNRWLSPSHSLARNRLGLTAANLPSDNRAIQSIANASDPVEETLQWTSLYEVSSKTHNELSRVASEVSDPNIRAWALLSLAVASPEFALA